MFTTGAIGALVSLGLLHAISPLTGLFECVACVSYHPWVINPAIARTQGIGAADVHRGFIPAREKRLSTTCFVDVMENNMVMVSAADVDTRTPRPDLQQ